jgi:hypothetical protein
MGCWQVLVSEMYLWRPPAQRVVPAAANLGRELSWPLGDDRVGSSVVLLGLDGFAGRECFGGREEM